MALKKVDLNSSTTGNYGTYQYGSLATYDPKYEKEINGTLNQIQNYGDYKSQFRQEERSAVYQQEGQKKAAKDDVRVSQVADQLE